MRRFLAASLVSVLLMASSASAAEETNAAELAPAVTVATTSAAERLDLAGRADFMPRGTAGRPMALPALYAASALLQGYDAYSTLSALGHGGREANPMMTGITSRPAMFIGLKAGVTAMSIVAAERMWKNHNRVGAVVTMVAANSMMAMVAAHNASVLASIR